MVEEDGSGRFSRPDFFLLGGSEYPLRGGGRSKEEPLVFLSIPSHYDHHHHHHHHHQHTLAVVFVFVFVFVRAASNGNTVSDFLLSPTVGIDFVLELERFWGNVQKRLDDPVQGRKRGRTKNR
ncbi:hypothetical protein HZH66_003214 [Vespula vulgaris]|uniref:Uncharacterized protein n=1 Tax=Vespula vulgaris TaxID=7454 RepID=A0A834NGQ0_VESVU|nr:hypothetical protein HZH66_003214 [Vespula vulgaris]